MPNEKEKKYSLYMFIKQEYLNINMNILSGNIEEINSYTRKYEDEQSIINEYKESIEKMYNIILNKENIKISIVNNETNTIQENKIILYGWIIGIVKILLGKEQFIESLLKKYPGYEPYINNEKSDYVPNDLYIDIYKYYKSSMYNNLYPEEILLKKYNQNKENAKQDENQLTFF